MSQAWELQRATLASPLFPTSLLLPAWTAACFAQRLRWCHIHTGDFTVDDCQAAKACGISVQESGDSESPCFGPAACSEASRRRKRRVTGLDSETDAVHTCPSTGWFFCAIISSWWQLAQIESASHPGQPSLEVGQGWSSLFCDRRLI